MNQIDLIPTKQPDIYQVQLSLDFQNRYIGKLDISGEGTFTTSRKPEHLFKKTNAIGINYSLLQDSSIPFKWIFILFGKETLITSRFYFLRYGKVFTFTKAGFETQIFLPVNEFGLSRAKQFESRRCVQQNLFPVM